MADLSVRPARPGDAEAVASVQLAAWQAAYRAILPAELLAGPAEDLARVWHAAVATPPSPLHRVLVSCAGTTITGFAASTPADGEVGTAELAALLVAPEAGRRGHGSRLVAAAVDGWRAAGLREAVMWVWDTDAVTLAFLQSAGWAADGGRRALDTGAGVHGQLRLRTALTG